MQKTLNARLLELNNQMIVNDHFTMSTTSNHILRAPNSHITCFAEGKKQSQPTPESKNETTKNVNQKNKKPLVYTKKVKIIIFLIFVLGTIGLGFLSGFLGGRMSSNEITIKPPLFPPKWLFPSMWSLIYILMGLAVYFAFVSFDKPLKQRISMHLWYYCNLLFILLWPFVFYKLNSPIIACFLFIPILITSIVTLYKMYYLRTISGIFYTMYNVWLLYMFYLNISIVLMA